MKRYDDLEERLVRYFQKQLRRFFYRSPVRGAVFARYKRAAGFLCLFCGKCFKSRKELHVEHVSPVIPVDKAFVPAGERFLRMFDMIIVEGVPLLSLENLALSCSSCRAGKTKAETRLRAANRTGAFSERAKERGRATRARNRKKLAKRS